MGEVQWQFALRSRRPLSHLGPLLLDQPVSHVIGNSLLQAAHHILCVGGARRYIVRSRFTSSARGFASREVRLEHS